ncbi:MULTISPECIES: V-type ATP synthase subunit C [Haloferax]|uniref:A-type ATP synthase subunit C n=3 Tax=Haloferax TaxID=2251 RepID=M0IBQ6_9EURY|nr:MULTISPECIES: V-type ATP synthase subunit C [Haloferax]ELZ93293.1 V-type ATP synthase subunit C [Haloferax sulfurifontis ATCC BAA-897]EMA05988.1 V-type ATP synthase subunit C [Haloferax denitrificans ATCC 35960]GGC52651.1 ATP synthase subunit C [Haloferax sulfurifontis]
MSTTGGSNPEYVIARVRARRSALFGDEEYRKLVRMGPAEIARFMEESEYETEVNALGSRFSGVDLIEYALNRNLAKQFNDILDWADGRLYDLIARYLRKFDAWNVKTIIRGVYSGAPRDEVESDLIRAGEFDDRLISRLLDAGEMEEVVDLLSGTIFGDGLAAAYEEFEDVGVLVPLENAVDRAFYEQLLDGLVVGEEAKQYREFLEAEIDFRNARNALRIARSGADLDPVDYFIEGGTLFRASELASLAASPDELVSKIRDSRYGDRLSTALSDLEEADSLIGFERALDAALLEYADTLGYVFPLSVTPIVSYILAKEREVDNIRAIARGREAGLDPDAIEAELVIL